MSLLLHCDHVVFRNGFVNQRHSGIRENSTETCPDSLNKIPMLSLFRKSIALEIISMISLSIELRNLSHFFCIGCCDGYSRQSKEIPLDLTKSQIAGYTQKSFFSLKVLKWKDLSLTMIFRCDKIQLTSLIVVHIFNLSTQVAVADLFSEFATNLVQRL